MADVLNLVPKKEIFEGIMNRTINEIPIDATPWWIKRLIDKDTNSFKDFRIVRLSCGSSEKFDFLIDEFDLRDNQIIVKLLFDDGGSEEEFDEELLRKNLEEDERIINDITENAQKSTFQIEVKDTRPLRDRVNEIIAEFVSRKNVFVVPTETVTIRTNGQIVGTNKSLVVDKDLDMTFDLRSVDFVLYKNTTDDDFINYFKNTLERYYRGNYVFICMRRSGWTKWASGEDALNVKIDCKKSYLIGRR